MEVYFDDMMTNSKTIITYLLFKGNLWSVEIIEHEIEPKKVWFWGYIRRVFGVSGVNQGNRIQFRKNQGIDKHMVTKEFERCPIVE